MPCQKLINEPSKELVMILSLAAFHCGASVDPFTSSFFSLRFPSLLLPSNQTPWYLTIIRSTWNAPIDSSFQTERQSFISIGWRIYYIKRADTKMDRIVKITFDFDLLSVDDDGRSVWCVQQGEGANQRIGCRRESRSIEPILASKCLLLLSLRPIFIQFVLNEVVVDVALTRLSISFVWPPIDLSEFFLAFVNQSTESSRPSQRGNRQRETNNWVIGWV